MEQKKLMKKERNRYGWKDKKRQRYFKRMKEDMVKIKIEEEIKRGTDKGSRQQKESYI